MRGRDPARAPEIRRTIAVLRDEEGQPSGSGRITYRVDAGHRFEGYFGGVQDDLFFIAGAFDPALGPGVTDTLIVTHKSYDLGRGFEEDNVAPMFPDQEAIVRIELPMSPVGSPTAVTPRTYRSRFQFVMHAHRASLGFDVQGSALWVYVQPARPF